MNLHRSFILSVIAVGTLCGSLQSAMAADAKPPVNTTLNYLLNGEVVSGWNLQVGDPDNWNLSVTNRAGSSAGGRVSVEPADYQGTGDALKLSWAPRKSVTGVVALFGSSIDLSQYENTGALLIQLRVDVKPDKNVTIGMDCGYPCGGSVQIRKNLADLKKGEWAVLPIPLNCFSKEKVDLKKVHGPFKMSTDGKLGITIANIHLAKLVDGDKGCAE